MERPVEDKIYAARITFRITKKGRRTARVQLRYARKDNTINKDFEFPENIEEKDLCWTGYSGERIAVYHRQERFRYSDLNNQTLPIQPLGEKLERLVDDARHLILKNTTT